jgi:hypothetical protein
VTSWFGDEEAERRRMQDDRSAHPDSDRGSGGMRSHRGPSDREHGAASYGGGPSGSYAGGSGRDYGASGGGRDYGTGGGERDYGARGGYSRGPGESGGFGRDDWRERPSIPYPGTMNQSIHEPRGGRDDFGSGHEGQYGRGGDRDERSFGQGQQSFGSSYGRPGGREFQQDRHSGFGAQDFNRAQYGRQEFSQDQDDDRSGGPRYNYGGWGDEGGSRRESGAGRSGGVGDAHYHQLRQRHIEDLDRDYDEYRREHQSRFENEFSGWRQQRQTKRQMLQSIREDMEVVGSDGQRIGTADKVRGDTVILNRRDPEAGGVHRSFTCTLLDRIEGDRIILNQPADQVRQQLKREDSGGSSSGGGVGGIVGGLFGSRSSGEGRSADLSEGQGQGEGAHILDRSFSGTYENKNDK